MDKVVNGYPINSMDICYLTEHFTPAQLRQSLRHAEIELAVSTVYGEESNAQFWELMCIWYQQALDQARPAPDFAPVSTKSAEWIKAHVDMVQVIGNYTKLRKSGKEWIGKCPFREHRHAQLSVNPDKGVWHCFGCNLGGDVINFICQIEKVSASDALKRLSSSGS